MVHLPLVRAEHLYEKRTVGRVSVYVLLKQEAFHQQTRQFDFGQLQQQLSEFVAGRLASGRLRTASSLRRRPVTGQPGLARRRCRRHCLTLAVVEQRSAHLASKSVDHRRVVEAGDICRRERRM